MLDITKHVWFRIFDKMCHHDIHTFSVGNKTTFDLTEKCYRHKYTSFDIKDKLDIFPTWRSFYLLKLNHAHVTNKIHNVLDKATDILNKIREE